MNEESEVGVATGGVEAAPVVETPAEAAPSSEGTEAVKSEGDSLSSDESTPTEAAPSEAAPISFPSAEEFGWGEWDGEHSGLPELLQPWGEKLRSHYDAQSSRTQSLYDALLSGQEDPRIKEYTDKMAEWESKYGELEGSHNTMKTEYDTFKKGIEVEIEEEAKQYSAWFQKQHPDIFNNSKLGQAFAGLLDQGWDLSSAAEAVKLPAEALVVAMKAKADGVPDSYALKFAKGTKSAPPAPRAGARITSGATTPVRSAEQSAVDGRKASTLKDHRNEVALRVLNSNRRR
jgi:hypothetical protein